jgi:hypothetical protein
MQLRDLALALQVVPCKAGVLAFLQGKSGLHIPRQAAAFQPRRDVRASIQQRGCLD